MSESFWMHLYDGSCKWPIIVRIYAVSQPEILREIEIGLQYKLQKLTITNI